MAVKVLHIITQLELGGAQKSVLQTLSLLDRKSYEIHLISSDGLLVQEARAIPGIHLTLSPFLKRRPDPILDTLAFFALVSYIKQNKIDIVHTHSSKAGILGRWAARVSGVPVIIHTVHGWGFHEYLKSLLRGFYIFLERITAKITTKLIAVTESDIQTGIKFGIGNNGRYALIRYGVDVDSSSCQDTGIEEIKSRLRVNGNKVVGMVACLKPQKNPVDFVIGADLILKEYPGTKFLLIGDGILRQAVEREIVKRDIKDSLFLLGWRRDAGKLMALLDVFVLTSLWEGMPLVFLEAMKHCKPVVAYDVCGVSELVKDGHNGFLVTPKNTVELSDKIKLLLDNDDLRNRMGSFAKRSTSGDVFSPQGMVAQISRLYEECMHLPR